MPPRVAARSCSSTCSSARISRARASTSRRGVDHGRADEHALGRHERGARDARPACAAASSTVVGEVHVAQHGARDPARRRLGLDRREQAPLPRQADRHRTSGRDRDDRAVALGRVGERALAVGVHDGVGERAERRDERARERRLHAHEVAQQADRLRGGVPSGSASPAVSSMSWRRASSRSRRDSCRRRMSSSSSSLSTSLRRSSSSAARALGQRRGLPVHLLDVGARGPRARRRRPRSARGPRAATRRAVRARARSRRASAPASRSRRGGRRPPPPCGGGRPRSRGGARRPRGTAPRPRRARARAARARRRRGRPRPRAGRAPRPRR